MRNFGLLSTFVLDNSILQSSTQICQQMDKTNASEPGLSISGVEREVGLSKDILRVWERRYGFPQPARDAHGTRLYSAGQIEKLRLIKRLMECGHRPGRLLAQTPDALAALGAPPEAAVSRRHHLDRFLDLVKRHQSAELRRDLSQALLKQGLQQFVLATIAPLNIVVGEAWMRGELAVFEEHLYTEQIDSLLRNAIASIYPQNPGPCVLLTTFPNELHGIGLLMVEALLAMDGASCIPLGTQTPLSDIARAATAHRADIVAVSFSSSFSAKTAASGLAELRAQVPESVSIWAGGAAVKRIRKPVAGVELIPSLEQVSEAAQKWRDASRAVC
jgi:MerR family transcriptional regulator, light-induced transcriptional regulator